jgi:mannose-6-phosphate isomerase
VGNGASYFERVPHDGRFPLLLKFIDARRELSVQVHPDDESAKDHTPPGRGKTEAWVILDANPATSRIYAGLVPGTTAETLQAALTAKTVVESLYAFSPRVGDCVFLPAGTVHAIGRDILLFEVQQTSDITYRLYDWDRVDPKTGLPRETHVERAIRCTDFSKGPCGPVSPDGSTLVDCAYFRMLRLDLKSPTKHVGPCLVVCLSGMVELKHRGKSYLARDGAVYLVPKGETELTPHGPCDVLKIEYDSP